MNRHDSDPVTGFTISLAQMKKDMQLMKEMCIRDSNKEDHVKDIDYLITLEGYVHWKLTGQRVLGIGDCAGMFPVDSKTKDFNQKMINQFDHLVEERNFPWKLRDIPVSYTHLDVYKRQSGKSGI